MCQYRLISCGLRLERKPYQVKVVCCQLHQSAMLEFLCKDTRFLGYSHIIIVFQCYNYESVLFIKHIAIHTQDNCFSYLYNKQILPNVLNCLR